MTVVWQLILASAVVAGLGIVIWRMALMVQTNVQRLLADPDQGMLSSHYPVFSRRFVLEANALALKATRELVQLQADVMADRGFREGVAKRHIPVDVSARMLEVIDASNVADECWHRHATFMQANMSVLNGTCTRDAALTHASEQLAQIPQRSPMFSDLAARRRDEWKARLEAADTSAATIDSSPSGNIWFEWNRQRPGMLNQP